MTIVTWRQQIVAYCVLFVARMFADDPQLVQDLKNLSNKITTQSTDPIPQPPAVAAAPSRGQTLEEFATRS
jgi:hypothetical protein